MTPDQFADLQEVFVLVFGPILQWLFVGIAVVVTGLLVLQSGLGLLRRMLGSGPGNRQNL
jgi:uncharacterized membrane protein required for colicin V production